MNIIDAAEILNIRHDADYLVVKAAWKALAQQHHPDHGGSNEHMQRLNEARDYMVIRTKEARTTEWNRLHGNGPRPLPDSSEILKKAKPKPTPQASQASQASHTRYWTPPKQGGYKGWKARQPRLARALLAISERLLILAARMATIIAAWYCIIWLPISWAFHGLTRSLGVLGLFIGLFLGATWAFGMGKAMLFVSGNFLMGGWKGLMEYLDDAPARKPFKVNGKDVYL